MKKKTFWGKCHCMHASALWTLWNEGVTNHRLFMITLSAASGWLVSPVLPSIYRFWAFIRRTDESPLVKPSDALCFTECNGPSGDMIININNHEPKGAVDKGCICLHVVSWSKKHLVEISMIWRKIKHFSKNNGSICTALEGFTPACVLLCFYMDY